MFSKCNQCGFNVRQTEKFCFNCGYDKYGDSLTNDKFYQNASIAMILAIIPTYLVISNGSKDWLLPKYAFITLITFLTVSLFRAAFQNMRGKERLNFQTLRNKEKVINGRSSELVKRSEEISLVISQIEANPTPRLLEVKNKLLSAQEIVGNQAVRYELQTKWIILLRLQNRLSPILEGWQNLENRQMETALTEIETAIRQTENLKNEISGSANEKLAQADFFEKDLFFEQLDQTKNGCEQLRETLLTEKAFRALRGLQTSENSVSKNNLDQSLTHKIETFNVQATLTDFSEAFDKLENEYQSLKATDEISQNLLSYENH